jgi:microcin C transport system permease protein
MSATASASQPNQPPPGVVVPQSREESISVLRRRWRKFRTLRRGWTSFLVLIALYAVSLVNPLLINSRALVVRYHGETYFPALAEWVADRQYPAATFDQNLIGEADYRALQRDLAERGGDDFVVMPLHPYHPNESLLEDPELVGPPPHKPTGSHVMGTDDRGRDVFARLAYGFRISITFALFSVLVEYVIGMAAGAYLGFFGGRPDFYGMRFVEIWSAIPFLYTIMIITQVIEPSVTKLAVLLGLFAWVGICFYMRGEYYREKARDYVAAAIAQGESRFSIMFSHVLPNSLTPVISFAPFAIVGSITALVSLDFLGFGLPPPTPSWGELVNQGKQNIHHWHLVVFPLAALFVTLNLVVFIGEAVREAFDPKVFSRLR